MMTVHCYFNGWMAEIGVCTCFPYDMGRGAFLALRNIEKNQVIT